MVAPARPAARRADAMGMNLETGKRKGVTPEMNVTPLVDVVLVLLIIFMVITPLLTKNFWVHTPKQEKEEIEKQQLTEEPNPPLVLRVGKENAVNVNGAEVPLDELPDRLRRMFAAREDHILFFDAQDDVEYGFAVQVMDKAREGGAVTIAALTTALEAQAPEPSTPEGAPAVN
jgi:biopolymer transport protein ExbD/biopolymer transport protein TolR